MGSLKCVTLGGIVMVAAGASWVTRSAPAPVRGPGVLYVDDSSTNGLNDGSSWEDAYVHLQDALEAAKPNYGISQIWVAEGIYTPDRGRFQVPGNRLASFELVPGVSLYGGFTGTEAYPDEREPEVHTTVLSGDLLGNDGWDSGASDNSVHVVTMTWATTFSILDGFSIRSGRALSAGQSGNGGGAWINNARVVFLSCRFENNSAFYGGGVYCADGEVSVINSVFASNRGLGSAAAPRGGPSMGYGGASYAAPGAKIAFTNCRFERNAVTGDGGALYIDHARAALSNCTLSGNAADLRGGGVFVETGSECFIANSILWANRDRSGGTEGAQVYSVSTPGYIASYSCIEGWTGAHGGQGNRGDDPRFFNGVEDSWPSWTDGVESWTPDLHLRTGSPLIDAGHNQADTDPWTSGVQPLPSADANGNPRFIDDPRTEDTGLGGPPTVDMGPFEYQPGDCNHNGVDDAQDISAGTSSDCNSDGLPDECQFDCNRNGTHDACDIVTGQSQDCNKNATPDECEPDCNSNGVADECDLFRRTSVDCNDDGTPDECETAPLHEAEMALDARQFAGFGRAVSINRDTVLVGALSGFQGRAYVFRRHGSVWIQETRLAPSGGVLAERFGEAVAIRGDVALVGAPWEDIPGASAAGVAYVFRFGASGWAEEARLIAEPPAGGDFNGRFVALGVNRLVTVAPGDGATGSARVFCYEAGVWAEEAKLVPSDGSAAWYGGLATAVGTDVVALGPYVFRFDGKHWEQEAKLVPQGGDPNERFGQSVAVGGDRVVVGSPRELYGSVSGSAYVFRRGAEGWVQEQRLAAAEHIFGSAVAIHGDVIAVGAEGADDRPYDSGAIHVFRFEGSSWIEQYRLTAPYPQAGGHFGAALAMDGNRILVGEYGDYAAGYPSGSAQVFSLHDDCNSNGLLDECDVSTGMSRDCNMNDVPDECEGIPQADLDCDGDVDAADLAVFRSCHTLLGQAQPAGCEDADLNGDGRVDCSDWTILRDAWTDGQPPSYARCRAASQIEPASNPGD